MIITVGTALAELGVSSFVLNGEPQNETEFNEMFRKTTGIDDNGAPIENADPSAWGVTWSQVSAKLTELRNAEPLKLLREERNQRLTDTDWVVVKAQETGGTVSTEWQTYRQALRDITDTYSSLDTVVWPTKP